MKKQERKLTEKELKRKEKFEKLCSEMEQKGYVKKDLTIDIVQANIVSFFIMLPFMVLTALIYYVVNHNMSISFEHSIFLFVLFICLIIFHELLHGLTWGIFAKNHFKSIDFGVIWSMLTPYCTCSEPMKKWQYILGCAMPTLVLGFGLAAIAVICHQFLLFILSELMILSGGGDFLIIIKVFLYRSKGKEAVYHDHPYECGVVVFEK